jgi:uncharacterized DUF497 family protein
MSVHFEWDRRKADFNRRRHRVSFNEASTVFDDPLAFIFDDEEHSTGSYGKSQATYQQPLVASVSLNDARSSPRYTDCTKKERKDYEENYNRKVSFNDGW